MYYFIRQNLFEEQDVIEIEGHTVETGDCNWLSGHAFSKPLGVQELILDPSYGGQLPDFFDTTIPIMSERLINFIADCGVDNISRYPVILKNGDQPIHGFFAVNVVGCIDAVDWGESVYTVDEDFDEPYFTGKIAIDAKKVSDALCFRLPYGPGFIVVSQNISEALKTQAWKSVMLQPTEEYEGV